MQRLKKKKLQKYTTVLFDKKDKPVKIKSFNSDKNKQAERKLHEMRMSNLSNINREQDLNFQ